MKSIQLITIASVLAFSACVPKKKYTELDNRKKQAEAEIAQLKTQNDALESKNKECNTSLETTSKNAAKLSVDTASYGKSNRALKDDVQNLTALNDTLTEKMNRLLSNSSAENKRLLSNLQSAQEQLNLKEVELKDKEMTLKERESKINEMQRIIASKDSASLALKNKLNEALIAFKNKGLTVTEKDGKVYVSLEAKLLFASGSTSVDPNGKKALVEVAKAIESEKNIEIVVEGHTDTDQLASSAIPRDNWELSVLRATEVVKIMRENSSIAPEILTASGRSQFHPVDESDKSKNRRIEIIIQPNLSELYKLIESN